MTIADWYERVNAAWGAGPPPKLTEKEAMAAGKRLYRFAMKRTFRGEVQVTSGNRYTWIRHGVMVVNPGHGWHGLVHLLSHYCHRSLHPGHRPHSRGHARLELRMVKAVVKRGWLGGSLQPAPKPMAPAPDPKALRYRRTLAAIARWETKQLRAERALKRLALRRRYYERTLMRKDGDG